MHQKVAGLIPGQDTSLGCGFDPQWEELASEWAGLTPALKLSLPCPALRGVSGSAFSGSLPFHLPVGLTNGRPHRKLGDRKEQKPGLSPSPPAFCKVYRIASPQRLHALRRLHLLLQADSLLWFYLLPAGPGFWALPSLRPSAPSPQSWY